MYRSDTSSTVNRSLSIRLLAYVVTPLVVCVTAGGLLVLRTVERHSERRMEEDVELVARALQRPVGHALERGHDRTIQQALESALQIGRVYGAYVYDDEGRLLVASGRADERRPPRRARALDGDDPGAGRYGHVGDEAVYSYFVPVGLGDGRVGLLEITRRKQEMQELSGHLRMQTLGVVGLGALVVVVIVLSGYRGAVGAALDRLVASIRRVQAGDVDHRADVSGPREVGVLVQSFNTMLDSLREAEQVAAAERESRGELQLRLVESEKLASIGHLAAGIAHELGTPLATVGGRVQRVLRRDDLSEQAAGELRGLVRDVGRMERLVRQVLEFGRHDGDGRRASCSAHTLATMAVASVRGEAEQLGVRLTIEGREPVPTVRVNLVRAEQALVNLLRNAMQAVEREGGGRVELSWELEGPWVVYNVEDDGPGVPEELRTRIFEPFFTTKKDQEGTGLGLGIVRAVAREHGGAVTVQSVEPHGSRFSLALPTPGVDGR